MCDIYQAREQTGKTRKFIRSRLCWIIFFSLQILLFLIYSWWIILATLPATILMAKQAINSIIGSRSNWYRIFRFSIFFVSYFRSQWTLGEASVTRKLLESLIYFLTLFTVVLFHWQIFYQWHLNDSTMTMKSSYLQFDRGKYVRPGYEGYLFPYLLINSTSK